MTTENTTTVDSRENAYGTTPISWWGWPDEARLADFAGQDVRAEKDDRVVDRAAVQQLKGAVCSSCNVKDIARLRGIGCCL